MFTLNTWTIQRLEDDKKVNPISVLVEKCIINNAIFL